MRECGRCGTKTNKLRRCDECRTRWYCGRECQEKHWKGQRHTENENAAHCARTHGTRRGDSGGRLRRSSRLRKPRRARPSESRLQFKIVSEVPILIYFFQRIRNLR